MKRASICGKTFTESALTNIPKHGMFPTSFEQALII
jgi:hypothetical protein